MEVTEGLPPRVFYPPNCGKYSWYPRQNRGNAHHLQGGVLVDPQPGTLNQRLNGAKGGGGSGSYLIAVFCCTFVPTFPFFSGKLQQGNGKACAECSSSQLWPVD